ncbi:MAG: MmgE/PrpD family protein [Paracoccaceae bacterium]
MKDVSAASPLAFASEFRLSDAPDTVAAQAKLCLLDLLGIAIGGSQTELARIICAHAAEDFGGTAPLIFAHGTASPPGLALAGGMMIDALDGHDGYNPAKGHIGCALLPAILALAPRDCSGTDLLEALIVGYELGSRLGPALHGTVSDYHTSGAWMAVATAVVGARLCGLNPEQMAHAAGIAEYHGPRSQMMRTIDTPTMLKDGSGWGAMAGVSAVRLARKGFTGAPALTLDSAEVAPWWVDLGQRWLILEQYFKPYPVCRWAHAPVEAALGLKRANALEASDITRVEIETFHESTRLAVNAPQTTEEAQYSTSFPVAIALVRDGISPFDLSQEALFDPEIRRLSARMTMTESARANAAFPQQRLARVRLHLADGRAFESDWQTPRWDAETPPSAADIRAKFDEMAIPIAGLEKAGKIAEAVEALPATPLKHLRALVNAPL